MSDLFISYASPDRQQARQLAAAFESVGWSVFWDRTIPTGKNFTQYIESALADARVVVVLWSKASVVSDWVRDEAADAQRRQILIPCVIDDVLPPLGFRSIQTAQLTAWNGSQDANEFKGLMRDLEQFLGARVPTPQHPDSQSKEPQTPTMPIWSAPKQTQGIQEPPSSGVAVGQHLANPPHSREPGGARLLVAAIIAGTLAPVFDWVLLPLVGGVDWWSYSADAIPHLRAGQQLMLNNAILAVATTAISSLVAYRGFVPAAQFPYVLPAAATLGALVAIFFKFVLDLASLGGWPAILIHNILFAYGSAVLWLAYQLIRRRSSPVN